MQKFPSYKQEEHQLTQGKHSIISVVLTVPTQVRNICV